MDTSGELFLHPGKEGNEHENNIAVSTETVRHMATSVHTLFYVLHNTMDQ